MNGAAGTGREPDPGPGAGGEWRALDRRTALVTAAAGAGVAAGGAVPAFLGLSGPMGTAGALLLVAAGFLLLAAGGAAVEYVRCLRTRYRVGEERVEIRSRLPGLERRRSLPRERVRSVDLTAHPLLRLLGLVKVRIGTGENTGGESALELHAVTRAEGERLRRELLRHAPAVGRGARSDGVLAALDPSWIRYAPASFAAPLLGGAAIGGVMQVSEWLGKRDEVLERAGDLLRDVPVVWTVLVLAAAALLTGAVGALAVWTEMWWGFRLEREPGGTLRVRRGLLTARSLSVEERRLRGVEFVEPLGVRLLGAARVDAVATGLARGDDDGHGTHRSLLPAVPRAVAEGVAARVLREPAPPTGAPLTAHPRAARTRRLRRAVGAALLPAAVLAALGAVLGTRAPLYAAGATALVLLPPAVLLALDAYRSLGHGLAGDYLVVRSGTVRRSTVALRRGGVIGWTVGQSYLQRRAGLLTLTATTAAGDGAYEVRDADGDEGLRFAAAAVPGLLEPFLEPAE
ncbi:PH domain-containing protein [Streptomyces somaliensis DSM 40738]|uniref:PH domain-containing protein n=1 Tax=Streptomyces somaliensis (strain ATCC 33201 / DSM 40738 / JCM 12659 / KCTC 9044 / NCTC 11332 / NRRL B-12077 / IP 733) TaxID=1134445 RepID=A0AA44DDB8_STRE0|nr:PH domain-containing protein [Streptomyces somaliensis]MCQ0022262.1 PH domain-containing protein [Streptomyces somaliensis DSM 40738]NKY14539.1 PH domain-containing protein [Streptomyces somaliensis DSM 40738]